MVTEALIREEISVPIVLKGLDALRLLETPSERVPTRSRHEPRLRSQTQGSEVILDLVMDVLERDGFRVQAARLAAVAGVSASALSRLFRCQTGLSIPEWKLGMKLKLSLPPLAGTTEPIKVIAISSGWTWPEDFSRDFRRVAGMPPTRFRQIASSE